ncbi:MAG: efflux RND transporter periplasmic adaptor subunit [Anaerolineaceae bacterium]|nr:efflux RND transporter periplasmic adaptor subunit [Anaerolineaceae bacterium]
MKRRTIIIIVIVIVLAVGGYFAYQNFLRPRQTAASSFQTVPVTRGSLTVTLGETGSVYAKQSAIINWGTSGSVEKINVNVGDKVTTDEILATLKQSSLPQSVITAQSTLMTAEQNLQDLLDSNTTSASAQLTLSQAQAALKTATDNRTYLNYQRASQARVDAAQATYDLDQITVTNAENTYSSVAGQPESSSARASALQALANARIARDTALANLNFLLSLPNANDIAQADANVQVAKGKLDDAQRSYNRVTNGPNPVDVLAAQAQVAAAQATLDLANIKAPFGGTVTALIPSVGDLVNAGQEAVQIDDLSHLLVDVSVPEVDINQIQVGQPVTFNLDAVPNKTYNGKVTVVGQAGTTTSGVVNFTVTAQITDADQLVKPDMTAAVNIITYTANNVILIPNRAIRTVNGRQVVYVLRNGRSVPTPVTISQQGDTNSQLVSGNVREGDLLVTNPTTTTPAASGGGFFLGGGGGRGPAGGGGAPVRVGPGG